jgi:hypothetical protein
MRVALLHNRRQLALAAVLFAITAVGLVLRLLSARGGLWLDEAWSAVYAAQARTPLGVFVSINHDNNHHLNSLWLQTIGLSAPPLLARAPSIIAGTAGIVVAAAVGARRSTVTAVIAASLFAASPVLVNYGAEARGYATMTLAFLGAILIVDRWLDDPADAPPRFALAGLAAFGLLSQLTMIFGLLAIAGWVATRLLLAGWRAKALDRTFDLMIPAIAVTLLVFTLVFGAAAASPTGLQVGSYEQFDLGGFVDAIRGLIVATTGLPLPVAWATMLVALALALSALLMPALRPRIAFYLLAIVGLPAVAALLQMPNSHYARYYLVSGIGMLLLIADWAGAAWARSGAARAAAVAVCAILLGASLVRDARQIGNDRADPAAPIAAMRAAAPGGTSVLLDNIRSEAVLRVAAASAHYPLIIRQACPSAPFFLLDSTGHHPFPDTVHRCGARYRPVLTRHTHGLPGIDWRLYRREPVR